MRHHFFDGVIQFGDILAAEALHAERFRGFHEIRQGVHIGFAVAAVVEHFLPLAHHAHILVVQDEDFYRQAVLHGGGQFLNVHHEAGFTGDAYHGLIWVSDLHTDGGGKAIAHGAEATGGEPAIRLIVEDMLCGPHLVLADIRRNEEIFFCQGCVQTAQRMLRFNGFSALFVAKGVAAAPCGDLLPPFDEAVFLRLGFFGFPELDHLVDHVACIPCDGDIDRVQFC